MVDCTLSPSELMRETIPVKQ